LLWICFFFFIPVFKLHGVKFLLACYTTPSPEVSHRSLSPFHFVHPHQHLFCFIPSPLKKWYDLNHRSSFVLSHYSRFVYPCLPSRFSGRPHFLVPFEFVGPAFGTPLSSVPPFLMFFFWSWIFPFLLSSIFRRSHSIHSRPLPRRDNVFSRFFNPNTVQGPGSWTFSHLFLLGCCCFPFPPGHVEGVPRLIIFWVCRLTGTGCP